VFVLSILLGVLNVLYVYEKQQDCCPLTTINGLTPRSDTEDQKCSVSSPNSKCSFTCDCGARSDSSCETWTVPSVTLRRPRQGRSYLDDFMCLFDGDVSNPPVEYQWYDGLALWSGPKLQYEWLPFSADHSKSDLTYTRNPANLTCIVPNSVQMDNSHDQYVQTARIAFASQQLWWMVDTSDRHMYTFEVDLDSDNPRHL